MIDRSLLSRIVSLFESYKSSKGGQWRDCDFRVATATDSPYARFKVVGAYFLITVCASGGNVLISRFSLRCVRHLPRPTGLPAHGSSHLFTRTSLVKSRLPPSSERRNARFGVGTTFTVIPRPNNFIRAYIYSSLGLRIGTSNLLKFKIMTNFVRGRRGLQTAYNPLMWARVQCLSNPLTSSI